jgi:hypothetical protein
MFDGGVMLPSLILEVFPVPGGWDLPIISALRGTLLTLYTVTVTPCFPELVFLPILGKYLSELLTVSQAQPSDMYSTNH